MLAGISIQDGGGEIGFCNADKLVDFFITPRICQFFFFQYQLLVPSILLGARQFRNQEQQGQAHFYVEKLAHDHPSIAVLLSYTLTRIERVKMSNWWHGLITGGIG